MSFSNSDLKGNFKHSNTMYPDTKDNYKPDGVGSTPP